MQDIAVATLTFVERNKELFEVMMELEYVGVFERMGEIIWDFVENKGNDYGVATVKIKNVYSYEVAAVLMAWVRCGFMEAKKTDYTNDLLRLSKNVSKRLNFLV